VPDIITTGKPMGNGVPVSGLLAKSEVLAAFSDKIPYFNTFGGNPVSMAAAQAVLKVIQEEELQTHSKYVGGYFSKNSLNLWTNMRWSAMSVALVCL
jgi:4-aminobutyrate aminotransferase-like enzyme